MTITSLPGAAYVLLVALLCAMGRSPQLCALFPIIGLLLVIVLVLAIRMRMRRSREFLAKFDTRSARCEITDTEIRLENALGISTLKWRMLDKVVRTPAVWLLFFGRQQYVPLPGDHLEGEVGDFVAQRIAAAGGKVI